MNFCTIQLQRKIIDRTSILWYNLMVIWSLRADLSGFHQKNNNVMGMHGYKRGLWEK